MLFSASQHTHTDTHTQATVISCVEVLAIRMAIRKQRQRPLRLESLIFLETLDCTNETAAFIYPDWRIPTQLTSGSKFSSNGIDGRGKVNEEQICQMILFFFNYFTFLVVFRPTHMTGFWGVSCQKSPPRERGISTLSSRTKPPTEMRCTIYKHHGPPKSFFLSELAGFRRLDIFLFSFSFLFPPSNSHCTLSLWLGWTE